MRRGTWCSNRRHLVRIPEPPLVRAAHDLAQAGRGERLSVAQHPAKTEQAVEVATDVGPDRSLANRDRQICGQVARRLNQRPTDRKVAPRVPDLVAELEVKAP